MTDHTKTVLVKGQHFLPLDENKQICKGENGGLLIFDEISKYLSDDRNEGN